MSNKQEAHTPMDPADIIPNTLRRAQYLLGRFKKDRCSEIAAALTYMSLFALVPLLTVLYAVGSAIPAFSGFEQQMQELLLSNLVPDTSNEVVDYINQFSQQAKNLTGVGIGILAVTAVLMLRNVERAFNNIWRNRENRSPIASFTLYWAVLSLAPVAMGLGIAVQAYLFAAAKFISDFDPLGLTTYLLGLVPFGLSVLGLTFLYVAVPNSQVPFKHALVGGFCAAIAFSIARVLFTTVMANSSYTFVYGAFAAVPLFLLWLYVTWNIVLMGGVLVHSLSAYQSIEQSNRPRVLKALEVLHALWLAQQEGKSMGELEILRSGNGIDSESWRSIRDAFMRANVITQDGKRRYLLARDLHSLTLAQLKAMIQREPDLSKHVGVHEPWQETALALLKGQRQYQRDLLSINLVDLFAGATIEDRTE